MADLIHADLPSLENRLRRPARPAGPSSASDRALPASDLVSACDQSDEPASECSSCGAIFPHSTSTCPSCSIPLNPALLPPVLLGKYRVERRLGSGGNGVVYKAVDVQLARSVAIKTLLAMAHDLALRLRREARAAAAVSHPNLAIIHAFEIWRGAPILIYEYLSGGMLSDRVRTGPLGVHDTLRYGRILADALATLHEAGILHRDLKPSNVGFTASGAPKVLDFGLARAILDNRLDSASPSEAKAPSGSVWARLTSTGAIIGTLPYLSPEAIAGMTPDESFDLWSLALILYECIAGVDPLHADDEDQTVIRIAGARIPDVRSYRSDCPEAVAELFHYALARDIRGRPQRAMELWDRLWDVECTIGSS